MSIQTDKMHNNEGYFEGLSEKTKEIVKEAIFKAADERKGPEGYKSREDALGSIECHARDGFSPYSHNKGGLVYRNFTNVMGYWGSGYTVAHEGAAKEIERQFDLTLQSISEAIYNDHASLCLELGISEKDCNYHGLGEFEKTSENLNDSQRKELESMIREIQDMECEGLSGNDSSIMHELQFFYHGKDSKGFHSASVSAAVNTEAPYHRQSIPWASSVFCEGVKEIEIQWRNNAELKRKLDKAFAKVSKMIF